VAVPPHAIWGWQPGQLRHWRFIAQAAQVEYVGTPWQPVRFGLTAQPMQPVHPTPAVIPHIAHVGIVAVPPHSIPVLNVRGGGGSGTSVVVQQTCDPQSALVVHDFGHVSAHRPLQQSCPVALQSEDVVQATAHGSYFGLRQSPATLSEGSEILADVQQASPLSVAQSEETVHAFGHRVPGTQKLFE
jgi:hypothetical protein